MASGISGQTCKVDKKSIYMLIHVYDFIPVSLEVEEGKSLLVKSVRVANSHAMVEYVLL